MRTSARSDIRPLGTVPQLKTFTVGKVHISCVHRAQAVDQFFELTSARVGGFITVRDAHGIIQSQTDERLSEIINNAQMTLPDGMPIVWVGKLKKAPVERVSGAEFFDSIIRDRRGRRIRHFFYGSNEETILPLLARVTDLLGADAICGWHCPPIRPAGAIEDAAILTKIAAAKPDVIWVGLSTPKQEYWMANHSSYFPKTIFVGIGAVFDFAGGTQPRAPKAWQNAGLEWLFRLIQEPKRLWPRYRRVIPAMLKLMGAEAVGSRFTIRAKS